MVKLRILTLYLRRLNLEQLHLSSVLKKIHFTAIYCSDDMIKATLLFLFFFLLILMVISQFQNLGLSHTFFENATIKLADSLTRADMYEK